MKFGKKYTVYVETEVQRLLPECSFVEFRRFKKLLKKCPHQELLNVSDSHSSAAQLNSDSECDTAADNSTLVVRHESRGSVDDDGSSSCPGPTGRKPNIVLAAQSAERRALFVKNAGCASVWARFRRNVCMQHRNYHGRSKRLGSRSCACDAQFFPNLLEAVSAIVRFFNARAQELLRLHLASGLSKYLLQFRCKIRRDPATMILLGNTLVCYGCMNALAIRKILKKYDKIHGSANGRAFKSRLVVMRAELLRSPFLVELGALGLNLMDSGLPDASGQADRLSQWCSTCQFDDTNHTLSCVLPGAIRLDFSLTCSICLEMVFEPVALGCGHIFCTSCACAAAFVPVFQGTKAAQRRAKCPLCRQSEVYVHAVKLRELGALVSTRCEDYYNERLPQERRHRLREAREHWDRELQAMLGL